ncbi:MAG: NADPH-dependent FMN reductase [Beijerinckiaceae bacterium]
MASPTILVLSGSIRAGSLNSRLAAAVAKKLKAAGVAITEISLADYPMPMVDATGFGNHPETAMRFRDAIDANKGMFIASPEYNAGYTPLLKNALDWATVAKPSAPGTGLAKKVVALGAASPGALGGYRGLTQMRTVLELGMGAIVIPEMAAVGGGDGAWNEDGSLKDERTSAFLDALVASLLREASFQR